VGHWAKEKEVLLDGVARLSRLGLIGGISGNISMRFTSGVPAIGITPSQRPYDGMAVEDIVVVNPDGRVLEGNWSPSSESALHLSTYRSREDVGAVVHTHSKFASTCAVAGLEIPPLVDEMVAAIGGSITVANYSLPGTQQLADQVTTCLKDRDAVLLRSHGVVSVGRNLDEAIEISRLVEHLAQIFVMARLLNQVGFLSDEAIQVGQMRYWEKRNYPRAGLGL